MNVVAEVFESDLPGIRLGSSVQVEVPQLPKPIKGTVRHLGATLDKESRRAAVVVELSEQNPVLRPGMQAKVGVQLSNQQEMLIPSPCLSRMRAAAWSMYSMRTTSSKRVVTLGVIIAAWCR
jgi:cobalt-zinc-cadmium efflux system membrane fusion protein